MREDSAGERGGFEIALPAKKSVLRHLSVLALFVSFSLLLLFVTFNGIRFSYAVDYLKAGDLVDRDVVALADVSYIDRRATERLYEDMRRTAPGIYRSDDGKAMSAIRILNALHPEDANPESLVRKAVNEIYARRYFDYDDLFRDDSDKVILDGRLIGKSELLHSRSVDAFLKDRFAITDATDPPLQEIKLLLVPNVSYDYAATMQSVSDAIAATPPIRVSFKKGDVIIARDEIVSAQQVEMLSDVRRNESIRSARDIAFRLIASFAALALSFHFAYLACKTNELRKEQFFHLSCFCEFLYLLFVFISYAAMMRHPSVFFYDCRSLVFFPSCLILMLTDKKSLSLALMLLNVALLAILPFSTIAISLKSIFATSLMLALFVKDNARPKISSGRESKPDPEMDLPTRRSGESARARRIRISLPRFGKAESGRARLLFDGMDADGYKRMNALRMALGDLAVMAAYALLVALMDYFYYPNGSIALADAALEAAKIAIALLYSYIMSRGLAYLLSLPTRDNLMRLLHEGNPLLDHFMERCEGSFEHCEDVMDIAMLAADAIGCDSLLVGVAAKYHDIGKMEHPEYFTENNRNESRHKNLPSKISAGIIKSHVPLGVKMLSESGLRMPIEALRIIEEHHGNDLISFFYYEAAKERDATTAENNAGFIDEDYFRYDSSKPSSKESAILMLCDISEAACRSLLEHSEERHRAFIHGLITAKLNSGQLDDSSITVGELKMVEEAIILKINAMYNTGRIKYPGQEKDGKTDGELNK